MPIDRYLELVKSALVNELYIELEAQLLMSVLCAAQGVVPDLAALEAVRRDRSLLDQLLSAKQDGHTILLERPVAGRAPAVDGNLRNYSEFSLTLVGRKRLDDLQHCVEDILDRGVPGDLLEAGVWRGLFWGRTLQLYLLIAPLFSFTALMVAAIVSSRVNDARTAQQLGGFLALPVTAVFVAQLTGQFLLGTTALVGTAVVLAVLNLGLLWLGIRVFQRETILMRWK